MDIDAINAANGFVADTGSASAFSQFTDNFDTFLTLLTAQLKHQDPLEPMDTSEFTNQLVQFSTIEQQIQTNKNLETLLQLQSNSASAFAVSFIGKEIEAPSDQMMLADGAARFSYTLTDPADNVVVTVADANGNVVYLGSGPSSAGRHEFTWNGETTGGSALPDGVYSFKVSTIDAEGIPTAVQTNMLGRVDAVRFVDGQPYLTVGEIILPSDEVVSVSATPQAAEGA